MWRIPGALLLAIWLRHYAYYLWPKAIPGGRAPPLCAPWLESSQREWAMYCFSPLAWPLVVLACWPALRRIPGPAGVLAVFAALWGSIEEIQAFGCGLAQWGQFGFGDVCRRIAGADVIYIAAGSAALSAIATWRVFHGRTAR
jgi:hypothetical protein